MDKAAREKQLADEQKLFQKIIEGDVIHVERDNGSYIFKIRFGGKICVSPDYYGDDIRMDTVE